MTRLRPSALLVAVVLLSFADCALGGDLTCDLDRVIDGDTVVLRCARGEEHVRLLRIDTPERRQPGFEAASEALEELLGDGPVMLEYEIPGVAERGTYGRLLAYLVVDGRIANVEMVRAGWSRFWTRFGAGRFADEFERAEQEARLAGRGIWAAGQLVMPEPADSAASESCRPRASCCRVCSKGEACGAACINADRACSKGRGCACNAAEVCS